MSSFQENSFELKNFLERIKIKEGSLLAVFYSNKNDWTRQLSFYIQNKKLEQRIMIIFISNQDIANSELYGDCLFKDQNFDLLKAINKENLKQQDSLIFLQINNQNLTYLTHRENLENEINWIEVINQFAINFALEEAENGCYRWGQKVPKTADYLCKDCGYVETFKEGSVFPICEVCLSGDPTCPEGYAGPAEGFWEMI